MLHSSAPLHLSVGDGDLDLHAGLDADGGDLLDDLGRGVQVDDPLVDAHLEAIPRLGALAARGLPRGDPVGRRVRNIIQGVQADNESHDRDHVI